jgi:hypothetical protein
MYNEDWSTFEHDAYRKLSNPMPSGVLAQAVPCCIEAKTIKSLSNSRVNSIHHHDNFFGFETRQRTPIPHLPLYKAVYGRPTACPYALKACAIVCVPTGKPATKPMSSSNEEITCDTLPTLDTRKMSVCGHAREKCCQRIENGQDLSYVPLYTLVRPVSMAALDGPHLSRAYTSEQSPKANKEITSV